MDHKYRLVSIIIVSVVRLLSKLDFTYHQVLDGLSRCYPDCVVKCRDIQG